MFTEANPDKGTKTGFLTLYLVVAWLLSFTEANPDKGTKTCFKRVWRYPRKSLQKLTPIRGRKQ